MIKSVSMLVRKESLTHAQFMKHWVDIHAPLAHAVPGRIKSFTVDEKVIIPKSDRA